jgi:DNA-directed RNA polymerase subunit RPC12/RpoP
MERSTKQVVTAVEKKEFPCNSCGAMLEFNPLAGGLACPYCGHEEAVPEEDIDAPERAFNQHSLSESVEMARFSDQAMEVACPSCRARVAFEPPDVAGKCPFCNTSIISPAEPSKPVAKPDGVLPCKVTHKEAHQFFRKWLGGHWFAPDGLKTLAQSESFQGVYLPYWTFDAKANTVYTGERGDYESTRNDDRRIRWQSIDGQFETTFDDIMVPATQSLSDKHLKRLKGWDLDDVVTYTPSFLAGFKAQRYQVPLDRAWSTAKTEMDGYLSHDVEADIGGDRQRVHSTNFEYSEITYKHVLLPVWMSTFLYQNKKYQVIVNGQTGAVIGDRPYSQGKIAISVGLGTLAVIGCLALIVNVGTRLPAGSSNQPVRIQRDTGTPFRHTAPRINRSSSPDQVRQRHYSPNKGSGSSVRRSRKSRSKR